MSGVTDPVERPRASPRPGEIGPFDAGWDAHAAGLERDTVRALTPTSGLGWALLGWDIRAHVAPDWIVP